MIPDAIRRLADAVLLEGYVLYPYRASSAKNQFRWAFGVVAPRAWSEAGGCEAWWCETQCLIAPSGPVRVRGVLRFIQARARRVEAAVDGGFREVDALEVDGARHQPWDEGEVREVPFAWDAAGVAEGGPEHPSTALGMNGVGRPENLQPEDLDLWERSLLSLSKGRDFPFALTGGEDAEPLGPTGRLVRTQWPLEGRIHLSLEPVPGEHPLLRLTLRAENRTPGVPANASRETALRSALIAAHLILEVENGAFVSLLDPPPWAEAAAKACRNTRVYPVLAGQEGDDHLLLASPIILYDHPRLAPESPGDFFDACEIDELLVLRTATLTEDERRQARGTDPRAAAILDRVERLSPERMEQLHGALRDVHRGEMIPRSTPDGIGPGCRVRLRPGARRTDAQDLLFDGCLATVDKLHLDVDGTVYAAVTVDGDPSAELHRWYGRFLYYRLDELERVAPAEAPCPVS